MKCELCEKGGQRYQRGPLTRVLCPTHVLAEDLDLVIAVVLQLDLGLRSHPDTFASKVNGFLHRTGMPRYVAVEERVGVGV